jgi:copper chaperone NosL
MKKFLFSGKLHLLSRLLLLVSAPLLLAGFIFPLWKISLWAPQYPEGLSLSIWINKFTGDVQTVNILNHYVGMAKISEESFPELLLFPKIFIALAIFAILTAIIGRKWISTLFAAGIISFALWALVDFYNWEYRFGHELNPDAAIKMEDMVYQPPLLGEKTFLNISASSWPDLAGYAFTIAVLISIGVVIIEGRTKEKGLLS